MFIITCFRSFIMRYMIKFSYDGTRYFGMQYQPSFPTIEGEFLKVLKEINKKATKFIFASRTDKGVHARCAYAHIDLDIDIKEHSLKRALNSLLSKDIYVKEIKKVANDFHARYNKCIKTYKYYLKEDEYSPFDRNYFYFYKKKVNITLLEKYIKYFIGKHNFYYFASPSDKKNSYIREIYEAAVIKENDTYIFYFKGNGFLKYQVRNMIGTILKLMENKISEKDFLNLFTDKGDFNKVSTAPSNALFLEDIEYV